MKKLKFSGIFLHAAYHRTKGLHLPRQHAGGIYQVLFFLEVIMGQAAAKKNFAHWSGRARPALNSGRIFVSKTRYFGPKLAGFCGPKQAGPKNRLKSRFWLAQSPPKAKRNTGGLGPGRKILPNPAQKRARPGQNDRL